MDMIQFAIGMGAPVEYFDKSKMDTSELIDEGWDGMSDYYKLAGLWQWSCVQETARFTDPQKEAAMGQTHREHGTKIKSWAAMRAIELFHDMGLRGEALWARIAEDNWFGISLCDMYQAVSQGYAQGAYGQIDEAKAALYKEKAKAFADEAMADVYFEGKQTPKDYWTALVFYTRSEIGVPEEERPPERLKRMAKCYRALGDYIMADTYELMASER